MTADNSNSDISSGANFKIKEKHWHEDEGLEISKDIYLVLLISTETDV